MALRLRRGTDAQRQLITPAEGELIYVTDTKDIYVGDGTTLGGVLVTAGINDLNDLADVNTSGALIGQVLKYDGTNWVASDDLSGGGGGGGSGSISVGADDSTLRIISAGESFLILGGTNISTTSDAEGNITINNDFVQDFAFSSLTGTPTTLSGYGITNALPLSGGTMTGSVNFSDYNIDQVFTITTNLVDTDELTANLINTSAIVGNLTGNIFNQNSTLAFDSFTSTFIGNFTGSFDGIPGGVSFTGDLKGSVFADDSSIVIDGISGTVNTSRIVSSNQLNIESNTSGQHDLRVLSDTNSVLKLTRKSDSDISGTDLGYGGIYFERDDINGGLTTNIILGYRDALYLANDNTGVFPESNYVTLNTNGNLGIGTYSPNAKLDVRGNGIFQGDLTAAAFIGSVMADDSTTIIDAVNGNVTASGYVQFGSFTSLERDLLSVNNGVVIYNTSVDRFQGYQNGSWINLDDGTAA